MLGSEESEEPSSGGRKLGERGEAHFNISLSTIRDSTSHTDGGVYISLYHKHTFCPPFAMKALKIKAFQKDGGFACAYV